MTEKDKKSIKAALGQGNDKYYVYMLCDKDNQPFYIGKGEGGRIWQHEEGEKAEIVKIESEVKKFRDKLSDSLSEYDKNRQSDIFRAELTRDIGEKYAKIEELGSENVKKVIVKWGLTNHEAYMVESALINMCKFFGDKSAAIKLTNIANGHRSKKEKEQPPYETKAQTVEEFVENCKKPQPFTEILEKYNKISTKTVKTANDGCGILFLTINSLYPLCEVADDKDAAILDATRGFWKIGEYMLNKIEYVFALYQSRVVGIYYVKDKNAWVRKRELENIEITEEYAKATIKRGTKKNTKSVDVWLPFELKDFRKREYLEYNKLLENSGDSGDDNQSFRGTTDAEELKTIGKRYMFTPKTEEEIPEDDKLTYRKIKEMFLHHYVDITTDNKKGMQNPIFYNFKANGEFKKVNAECKEVDEEFKEL